ncbi:hypothetical protein AC578_4744 [Pseudocercospora eumusae]|uniref:Uncharacterized protein n=1 Tax=Pseudocercospora eumusae TaxID=321146 RepID=A0A139HL59_9PEZI|nr:hypothetical protein AC578_4744 [Pseudocercospora eumusae]
MSLSYEQTFGALIHTRMDWKGESGLTHYLPPVPSTYSANSFYPSRLHHPLHPQDVKGGLQGLFAFLPYQNQIPETSVVHSQLNKVTSFNGQALQEKYARANDKSILWQYLQINHPASPREAPNGLGELFLTGGSMKKPSYVNLNGGFWIEWQYLSKFGHTGRTALTAESYFTATWAYAVAEQHRQQATASLACQIARPASPPLAFDELPYTGPAYYPAVPAFTPPSPPLEALNAGAPEFAMPVAALNPAAADFTFFQPPSQIYAPVPPLNPYACQWSYHPHLPVMV